MNIIVIQRTTVPAEVDDLVVLKEEARRRDISLLDLGYVDAAVVATCEFLDADRVMSLDRRHFSVVRPSHRPSLRVLPD